MSAAEVAADVLLGAGVLVAVASAVGALLMASVRDRLHFLSPVTSVAGPLVGAGLAVQNGWGLTTGQIVLIVGLLAITGPVLQSATGRLASRAEQDRSR